MAKKTPWVKKWDYLDRRSVGGRLLRKRATISERHAVTKKTRMKTMRSIEKTSGNSDKEVAGAKVENQPPRKLGLGKKVSAKLGHRLAGGQMNFFPKLSLGWGGGKKLNAKLVWVCFNCLGDGIILRLRRGLLGGEGQKSGKNCDPFFML